MKMPTDRTLITRVSAGSEWVKKDEDGYSAARVGGTEGREMAARHAILGLLMNQPMHGYEIDTEFERGLRRICHVNISQIYAYLKSMEDMGWIDSELVMQKSNPPKKVFSLTEVGRAELMNWLRQPVLQDRQLRDELLTKIYFCWTLAAHQLPHLLDEQIAIYYERLKEWRLVRDRAEPFITRAMADAGVRHLEADYGWLCFVRDAVRMGVVELNGVFSGQS
jgi:DNA-binding PadR family transcriptional regulator